MLAALGIALINTAQLSFAQQSHIGKTNKLVNPIVKVLRSVAVLRHNSFMFFIH